MMGDTMIKHNYQFQAYPSERQGFDYPDAPNSTTTTTNSQTINSPPLSILPQVRLCHVRQIQPPRMVIDTSSSSSSTSNSTTPETVSEDIGPNQRRDPIVTNDNPRQNQKNQIVNTIEPPRGLNDEYERLRTFQNWNSNLPVSKENLARFGFHFTYDRDIVKCYFCEVEVGQWNRGDDVYTEHKRWSPHCPLLTSHQTTDNYPIDSNSLNQELLERRSVDVCGSKPVCADYSIEQNRLKTFEKNWPKHLKQTPEELSDAGFFFLGEADQCKCFSCGGGLKDWEENDNPWEQHALWYSNCRYVNLMKGQSYIDEIKRKFESNDSNEIISLNIESKTELKVENEINEITTDKNLCKICYSNEINVVFMPCMHIISCVKCGLSVQSCPICRQEIKDVKKVFFS